MATGANQTGDTTMQTEVIAFAGQPIANTAQLAPGTGCRYMECIRSHLGNLIAKQWRRKPVGEVCLDFHRQELSTKS